jgi:hypothetical protein
VDWRGSVEGLDEHDLTRELVAQLIVDVVEVGHADTQTRRLIDYLVKNIQWDEGRQSRDRDGVDDRRYRVCCRNLKGW